MYRDNSLIPKEAIRMAALGALVQRDRPYAEIAGEVRQFAARIVGPSLDLLGTSIELLKLEGLVAVVDDSAHLDDEILRLNDAGRLALEAYLRTNIRPGTSDLNKLVIALKLRFIDVLSPEGRCDQLQGLKRMYEGERLRLRDLSGHDDWSEGLMPDWLSIDLDTVSRRIDWCEDVIARSRDKV